jgi:hypothetical protein
MKDKLYVKNPHPLQEMTDHILKLLAIISGEELAHISTYILEDARPDCKVGVGALKLGFLYDCKRNRG